MEFAFSPWVLQLPPTVHRHSLSGDRLIGKLLIGVNVGVNVSANRCLCLCVSPATDW